MSMLIVLGTPLSGSQQIWELLQAGGARPAVPSRTQRLSPQEINRKLLALQGIESIAPRDRSYQPIEPPELWRDLFLDLVLANAEQVGCWGWSDPNAIRLLNYWSKALPDTRFVLTYGSSGRERLNLDNPALDSASALNVDAMWTAYNEAMLAFYNRNREKCLLVHGHQALISTKVLLERVNAHLGLSLQDASAIAPSIGAVRHLHDPALAALGHWLSDPSSAASALFDELQTCADIPHITVSTETVIAASVQYIDKLQENRLLLTQLHQTQEELEHFYLKYESLAKKAKDAGKKSMYGAPDRIKRQLSYRLGATMLAHTKSFGGILSMPWGLIREAKAFKKEQKKHAGKQMPPLSSYADARQAEQVKQHLSYRLGATLISHTKSPLGWVTLPFGLLATARSFAADKSNRKPATKKVMKR